MMISRDQMIQLFLTDIILAMWGEDDDEGGDDGPDNQNSSRHHHLSPRQVAYQMILAPKNKQINDSMDE